MNSKLNELVARKAVLISRAALQREELARSAERFEKPAQVIDRVFSLTRTVARHPAILSSVTAFLMATNWRKFARLPKRIYQGWLLVNVLRNVRRMGVTA